MIISLTNQAYVFFITVLIGLLVGLIYDFFRLQRKLFTHSNTLVYIEDFLFWVISIFMCFYILLHKNNLELRFFLFVGMCIGISLYFSLLSNVVLRISIFILNFILKPLAFIFKILRPFFSKINIKKNKAISREKIFLQKLFKYGRIRGNNIRSTIKIIFKKT